MPKFELGMQGICLLMQYGDGWKVIRYGKPVEMAELAELLNAEWGKRESGSWTGASELPEHQEVVRLRLKCSETAFGYCDHRRRCWRVYDTEFQQGWYETMYGVTHWMSLPELTERIKMTKEEARYVFTVTLDGYENIEVEADYYIIQDDVINFYLVTTARQPPVVTVGKKWVVCITRVSRTRKDKE